MKGLVLHPEFQLYERKSQAFCSSLQVAETFEKRHDHVLRDIATINETKIGEIKDFFSLNFERVNYTDARGRKQPMYLITEEGFSVLAMGYTGDKAMYFKILYVKRFKDMENFIRNYTIARDEFTPFTRAIEFAHEEPKSYHYSNECDMINRLVLGCTAKQFKAAHGIPADAPSIRPYLTIEQSKAIRTLQNEDIPLLYQNVPFQERKTALNSFFSNRFLALGG